jgi:hypothetical protein
MLCGMGWEMALKLSLRLRMEYGAIAMSNADSRSLQIPWKLG